MDAVFDFFENLRKNIICLPGDKIRILFNSYIIHEDKVEYIKFTKNEIVYYLSNEQYKIVVKNDTLALYKLEVKRYFAGLVNMKGEYCLTFEKPVSDVHLQVVEKTDTKPNVEYNSTAMLGNEGNNLDKPGVVMVY